MVYPCLSHHERKSLCEFDVNRVLHDIKKYSELIDTKAGTGVGSVAAGTKEEKKMAKEIKKDFKKIGVDDVKVQKFPVMRYIYQEPEFLIDDEKYPSVSLHGAGGTHGTLFGIPFAIGNRCDGTKVVAEVVDGNLGFKEHLDAISGGVAGKIVLIKRTLWPVYQIIEAYNRGAAGLVMYGNYNFFGTANLIDSSFLKQDVFYNHLQLPVLSISEDTANVILSKLQNGPVTVTMSNRLDGNDGTSQNVIGEIKGSKYPDEYVLVFGHYDKWFKGVADNCSGLAGLLELTRFVKDVVKKPTRTHLFVGIGAEEAGIYNSTWDWLAGSFAFINKNPDIMRRVAYAVNLDIFGWTNDRSLHEVSADLLPFHRHTVEQAQVSMPVDIELYSNSNVDSWVLCQTGGGNVIFPGSARFLGENPNAGGEYDYQKFYHTDYDVFVKDRFKLLKPELQIIGTGLLLINKMDIVPVSFDSFVEHFNESLQGSIALTESIYPNNDFFTEVIEAFDNFKVQVDRLDDALAEYDCKNVEKTKLFNKLLMHVRREFFPWLQAASGYRVSLYNAVLYGIHNIVLTAQNGTIGDTLEVIPGIDGAGWWTTMFYYIGHFSAETFERERLYYYANNDWNTAYNQKAAIISEDLDRIYFHLQTLDPTDTVPSDIIDRLVGLQEQVRGHLTDALTITDGKLNEAADFIERFYPFAHKVLPEKTKVC